MYKHLLVAAGCLVAGFFIGFYVSNNINRNAGLKSDFAQNPAEAPFLNQQTQAVSVKEPNAAMLPDVTETLEKAKKEPENFEAQMKAGDLYRKIQGFQKAAEFYGTAAALKPTEYEKIVRLGNSFFDIGDFEKAEVFYLQAIEKKSDDVGVRTDLGITFVERANPDYDRAIKEFQTALAINSKHEPTLYNLAIAYYKKSDLENAKKYLTQLEQANPKSQLVGRLKELLSST